MKLKLLLGLNQKEENIQKNLKKNKEKDLPEKEIRFIGIDRSGSENPMYGKTHSDETKLKMKFKKQENPPIGENNPMYGKKQPTDTCQYCGKKASKTNIIRWHGENCKEKNKCQ